MLSELVIFTRTRAQGRGQHCHCRCCKNFERRLTIFASYIFPQEENKERDLHEKKAWKDGMRKWTRSAYIDRVSRFKKDEVAVNELEPEPALQILKFE